MTKIIPKFTTIKISNVIFHFHVSHIMHFNINKQATYQIFAFKTNRRIAVRWRQAIRRSLGARPTARQGDVFLKNRISPEEEEMHLHPSQVHTLVISLLE